MKNKNVKLLLVPHDIEDNIVKDTITRLKKHGLTWSLYSETVNSNAQVLVLNTMGLLSRTYYYANCAYIGGGFNSGLHNTLEAAVYNIPVTFYGTDYHKYNEAIDLLGLEAATNVTNEEELLRAFNTYLSDTLLRTAISEKLKLFFEKNSNVTGRVLNSIKF